MTEQSKLLKLHLIRAEHSELADPDDHLIDSLSLVFSRRPEVLLTKNLHSADFLIIEEAFSYKTWRYIERLMSDRIIGPNLHKVVTLNRDDGATGLLRGLYTSLTKRNFNPKRHRAVPYIQYPNEKVVTSANHFGENDETEPPFLATWRGNIKSRLKLRGQLLRLYGSSPLFNLEATPSWMNHNDAEQLRYIDVIKSGKFSLCPAGWAPVSFRIYESMALGVAPVIIADDFIPPVGPDWSCCSLRLSERNLSRLQQLCQSHTLTYSEIGKRAREAWERHFSPSVVLDYYVDTLLDLMLTSPPESLQAETAKLRSFSLFWANGWTLPQRALKRIKRSILPTKSLTLGG